MSIVIGIDTGGTYTDAIACNALTREIYAEAKSLTTHDDLSVGIHNALSRLPARYLENAEMVSLSTTLTTNACVEHKGCRALLILFGVDEESARRLGNGLGGYDSDDIWFIDTQTDSDGNIGRMPDWSAFSQRILKVKGNYQAYALVEIYANKTAACLEKEGKTLISELTNCPVVCGHELFTELNVLKRGSNALLNAKLIPLIHQFIGAVDRSLKELGVNHARVMIVRGDGTLMSEEYALTHPLDTLLCGPAASAIGAGALTDCQDAMIIDIGGTTSDITFLQNGSCMRVTDFVHIGGYTTFMNGFFINTFALGGDTCIRYRDGKLCLGTRRVIPMCILASQFPFVEQEMKALIKAKPHTRFIYEYLVLQQPLKSSDQYNDMEKKICSLLEKRPYSVKDTARLLHTSVYDINTEKLEQDGIILRSGLTPTDVMHIKGDFSKYNTNASRYCLECVARNVEQSTEELADQVYSAVKYRLFYNIACILMERDDRSIEEMDKQLLNFLLKKQWEEYLAGGNKSEYCQYTMHSKLPLIGIGGPAKVLLPDVAEAFKTRLVIPEHFRVANAIGAAMGCIVFSVKGTIQCVYKDGKTYLLTMTKGENVRYEIENMKEAVAYVEKRVRDMAAGEAYARGMAQKPLITLSKSYSYYDSDKTMLNQIKIEADVKGKIL